MSDIAKFLEGAKNVRGVTATVSLAGVSIYGGGYAKDFMTPHNEYVSWACTVAFCLSLLLLFFIAIRSTFLKNDTGTA